MVYRQYWLTGWFLAAVAAMAAGTALADEPGAVAEPTAGEVVPPKADVAAMKSSRKFVFEYGAELDGLRPGAQARVWFPIAPSNEQQSVELSKTAVPAKLVRAKEPKYGNEIGYFELAVPESGSFKFGVSYDVTRQLAEAYGKGEQLTEREKSLFLSANSKVPIDGRPVELIGRSDLPKETIATGQFLFDVVGKHMKYDKSKPGYGTGDSVWACDSRFGNCTDFHSLFISLSRSQAIAAKFEIGFPLPVDKEGGSVAGYHCWAWFHSESEGWFPVDISEADKHPEMKEFYFGRLTADRLAMSVGRDIELVPKSNGGMRNYFIYPHVEVDGEVLGKEKMTGRFGFQDRE